MSGKDNVLSGIENSSSRNRNHLLRNWLLATTLAVATLVGFNWFSVFGPATSALSDDYRNSVANVVVYHRWAVMPDQIVLDVRSIDGDVSRADVTRMLFQIAEAFDEKEFAWVILAHKGEAKFKIRGSDFQRIGREFSYQNPVFLMRQLPQKVYQLNGRQVFPAHYGGWLGVASAELDDLNELHDRWWLDDELYGG